MPRRRKVTATQKQEIARLLLDPNNRIVDIARCVGVSRATVYRLNNQDREMTHMVGAEGTARRGGDERPLGAEPRSRAARRTGSDIR